MYTMGEIKQALYASFSDFAPHSSLLKSDGEMGRGLVRGCGAQWIYNNLYQKLA